MKYHLLALFILLSGCSSVVADSNPIEKIDRLHKPVHIAEIKKLFGSLSNGHGSFVWVKLKDKNNEMWFWFLPSEDAKSDQFDGNPNQFEILFITIGNEDNPDSQKVVWPQKYIGQQLENVFNAAYKDLLSTPNS